MFGGADVGRRQAAESGGVGRGHGRRQRGVVGDVDAGDVPRQEGVDDFAIQERRVGVLGERRQRQVGGGGRIPQQLERQFGSAVIASQLHHHRGQVAAGRGTR